MVVFAKGGLMDLKLIYLSRVNNDFGLLKIDSYKISYLENLKYL
jgi:hypothetical protein